MATRELTHEQHEAISAKAQSATVPEMDPTALLEQVARYRAQLNDPKGIYANSPDVVAKADIEIKALLVRAGVTEVPETPLTLAIKQHDARFSSPGLSPPLAEFVAQHLATIPQAEHGRRAAELRAADPVSYDRLVTECSGITLPPGATADLRILKIFAAQSRHDRIRNETRPR